MDLDKARRERLRWMILVCLDVARPAGTSEGLILQVVQGEIPDVTRKEVRKELDYLSDRQLVDIHDDNPETWTAEINHHGVDVVEYTIPCLPGIARPPKYNA